MLKLKKANLELERLMVCVPVTLALGSVLTGIFLQNWKPFVLVLIDVSADGYTVRFLMAHLNCAESSLTQSGDLVSRGLFEQ